MKRHLCLLALALAGLFSEAHAQNCPQWDSNNPGCWQDRREEEDRQRQEAEDFKRSQEELAEQQQRLDAERDAALAPMRAEQARQSAEIAAATQALIAELKPLPPLQPGKNPLLGRWRVQGGDVVRGGDELSQLLTMMNQPGAAMCGLLFGGGVIEFLPDSWASIDGTGDDSLGAIQYRLYNNRVYALPAQGIELMGFEIVDANTVREARMPDCVLVRVGGAPPVAANNAVASPIAKGGSPAPASSPKSWPPPDPNSSLGRGIALYRDMEFQPALREFLAATQANPADARAFAFLGDTYRWLGMQVEAKAAFDTAVKLDPSALDALR